MNIGGDMPTEGSRKRILVTGGGGFLGSHLVDRLVSKGHFVICVDNLSSGTIRNIEHLSNSANFEFINHDVTTPLDVVVDQIYNLACPASPEQYQSNAIQTTRTNVLGALNMLELASRLNCPILQASTSEVYGDPEVHPQTEDYWGNSNPIGLRACYDEGKRCAESLFFDYHRAKGVTIKVARIFNTFGPRMQKNDGRVVSNFIVQALKGRDITIYGNGLQTRSFCFVDDLIDGLVQLMDAKPNVIGPINLGNPSEVTIHDLAKRIIDITGAKVGLSLSQLPLDDPKRRCPDISEARRVLNWEPQIELDEGLEATVEYFEKLMAQPR